MHSHCLIAQFSDTAAANIGLLAMQKDHYREEAISIITNESRVAGQFGNVKKSGADEQAMTGEKSIGLGALLGGAVAGPLAITTMIGPLFIAGPLAGMVAGAVTGGWLSLQDKWDVSEEMIRQYENDVKGGSVLLVVHGDETDIDTAERLLKTTGPQSLHQCLLTNEVNAKEP